MTDLELLADYCGNRSEKAFATLVERYVRLVHSACWRQLKDSQLAEDATQMVFVLLSQRGGKIRHGELAGWLITSAHYICANMKRSEQRRQRRHQVLAMQQPTAPAQSPSDLLPMLDEALLRLRDGDRAAVALRFFQDQPFREVGQTLGMSEEAARKRVGRGLEKLRQFFRDRGIETDSAALSAIMADHSHAPPVGETLTHRIIQAVHQAPAAPPHFLRPTGAVAAALVMSSVLGVTGWQLFKWSATDVSANTIRTAPAAEPAPLTAATLPVAEAAAEPDRSTPDNALASICQAMQAADRAGVYACLVPHPPKPNNVLAASLDEALASRRMILAGQKVYGADANKLLGNQLPTETVLAAVLVVRRMENKTADITGDTATITVEIPGALLRSVSGDVQQVLTAWSGQPIYFERREGVWRVDGDRSTQYVMKIQRRNNGPLSAAGDKLACEILERQAHDWDALAAQISRGDLPRLAQAQRAVQQRFGQVFADFRLTGIVAYVIPPAAAQP